MSIASKRVILCADDYGIGPGVNRAINQLAENHRISATSVMVCFDNWEVGAKRLLEFKDRLDIGLHFTLTNYNPLSPVESIRTLVSSKGRFFAVNNLVQKSFFKQINEAEVLIEFYAQTKRFTEFFGFKPDYIDGHHNVHQFPVIRKVLIKTLKRKNSQHKQYIRNTFMPIKQMMNQGEDFLKSALISLWGSPLKRIANEEKIPTNQSFAGVYDLKQSFRFEEKMFRFLKLTQNSNSIVMTHPGFPDKLLFRRDKFCQGRQHEYDFLMGPDFLKICKQFNIVLDRFNHNERD